MPEQKCPTCGRILPTGEHQDYELVIRNRICYLRRRPDRSVQAASRFKLMTWIQFAKLAISARGVKYKNTLPPAAEAVQIGMVSVGRTPKGKPVIELSPENLLELKMQMVKKGIQSVKLPPNVRVRKEVYVPSIEEKASTRIS